MFKLTASNNHFINPPESGMKNKFHVIHHLIEKNLRVRGSPAHRLEFESYLEKPFLAFPDVRTSH